jgi:homoserine dehydrogenase
MGQANISIDRMRQYNHDGKGAPVLIVTHKTSRGALDKAIADFSNTGVVLGKPVALRIET